MRPVEKCDFDHVMDPQRGQQSLQDPGGGAHKWEWSHLTHQYPGWALDVILGFYAAGGANGGGINYIFLHVDSLVAMTVRKIPHSRI